MKIAELEASAMSQSEKLRHLGSLSEDDFRDRVVRPIFVRQGMRDYRDLCGTDERGKDCILTVQREFGRVELIAIQTKKGKLDLTRARKQNAVEAITQLKTALSTPIPLTIPRSLAKPDRVFLAVSGPVGTNCREHIQRELRDLPITILDGNDLVTLVDQHYPEYWQGVDPKRFPYLRAVSGELANQSDAILVMDLATGKRAPVPVADDAYVPQFVFRPSTMIEKKKGHRVVSRPHFEEISDDKLLVHPEIAILVTGEGGSGKSTMIRRLAYKLCVKGLSFEKADKPLVPVILRAITISKTNTDLEQDVETETFRCSDGLREVCTQDDYEKGRVVIFVDALDEVRVVQERELLLKKLALFREARPKCRIIFTSREGFSVTEFGRSIGAAHFRISDFSLKQATRIVDRIASGKDVSKDQAKEILRKLESVHGVRLTPLLVTAFAASEGFQSKDIPPNITEIFTKFTSLMLGRWDQDKGLNQAYEYRVKEQVLKQIALHMHKLQQFHLPVEEYQNFIHRHMDHIGKADKAEGLMDEILRSGLIILDEQMHFRHPMLQEFFAGKAVDDDAFFEDHLEDDWWKNPLVFYFGDQPDRVDKLSALTRAAEDKYGCSLYNSAIAIGTALQACYLSGQSERLEVLQWTVSALARGFEAIVKEISLEKQFPLTQFIWYFLRAKDSVAGDLILRLSSAASSTEATGDITYRQFWENVGLLEAGYLEEAEKRIADFAPSEDRLLLAIHLLCFCVTHLKMSGRSERIVAERIAHSIGPKVAHYNKPIMQEFSGYILEMRQGQIKAIDATLVTTEGQYEMPLE